MAMMKVMENFRDKFLTCVICDSIFDDSATLQCGHSYCRKCLTSFIQSKPDSVRNKVIPCSMRCEDTRVPDPQMPVETWAAQIRPSLIIRNLLDEYKQMTGQPKTVHVHTQRFIQCEDHRGKTQDLICEDHKKPICVKCWGDKHRRCKSVVPMETKVEQILPDIVNYKSKLKANIENLVVRKETFQSEVDTLVQLETDTQSKLQVAFKKIVDALNEKESYLLHELKINMKSETQKCKDRIQSTERELRRYEERLCLIDKASNLGLVSEMYNIYQSYLSPEASNREIDISRSAYTSVRDIVLCVNSDHPIECINKKDFSTLDIRYETNTDVSDSSKSFLPSAACSLYSEVISVSPDSDDQVTNRSEETSVSTSSHHLTDTFGGETQHCDHLAGCVKQELFRSPVLADTVQCKLPGDKRGPELRDITVLDVDGIQVLVVTDYNNNCVKSFYTSNNKTCHSKLHLDNNPWGITQWKEHQLQVMVTVPGSYKILTVAVTPDLVLLSTISTSQLYTGLAVLGPSRLAAGSFLSGCVDILNMESQVRKSVSTHNNVKVFTWPRYMCVNNKVNLLVADSGKKSMTCLTSEGEVVWVYDPTGDQRLKCPRGIQWTPEGILLVDQETHKVILLTESGQYVRDVLAQQDGLHYPIGICVDKDNSLFVCCRSNVKHFKFTGSTYSLVKLIIIVTFQLLTYQLTNHVSIV